jgi:hypothetical protein
VITVTYAADRYECETAAPYGRVYRHATASGLVAKMRADEVEDQFVQLNFSAGHFLFHSFADFVAAQRSVPA